jgi:hypothetical protein
MKKINNVVIENQSPEFAVELKKFWERMGANIGGYAFSHNTINNYNLRYYGVIDGGFKNYQLECIPPHVHIFHHIPSLAELGLEEEITFPCEMEVWENDEANKVKAIISGTCILDGKKGFMEFYNGRWNYWKNARPLPKTLPLTLSELLTIASEVKGVQVTLKEEKP